MQKTWTIVLRNHKTGKTMIWEADQMHVALGRMTEYWRAINNHDWTAEADKVLRAQYGRMTPVELASVCSKLLCRRVTKNAVIGRYNRIKNLSPDDITYKPVKEDLYITKDPDSMLNTRDGWKELTRAR